MTDHPTLTEVIPEPGSHSLWMTFSSQQTALVDLTRLLNLPRYHPLRLSRLFNRAKVESGGRGIIWPGGVLLSTGDVLAAPDSPLPLEILAKVPAEQRYRPLLPYLQHLNLPMYARPLPIEPASVERLLQLKSGELTSALDHSPAPEAQVYARLYDIATFLGEHFGRDHLGTLLRHSWRYGQFRCPGQPHLHSMLGCMLHGRPDLIEQPCRWLATGEP